MATKKRQTSLFPVTLTPPAPPAAPTTPVIPIFTYDPSYLNDDVTVTTYGAGFAIVTEINADDCATEAGAQAMQVWLAAQQPPVQTTIVMGYPLYPPQPGDPDIESTQVPWLSGNGVLINAGTIIAPFSNLPYSMAAPTAIRAFAAIAPAS